MLKIDRRTLEEIKLGVFFIAQVVVSLKLLLLQHTQSRISKPVKKI